MVVASWQGEIIMPYLEDLIKTSMEQAGQQQFMSAYNLGMPTGMAYSSFYPEWEITSPQYQTPTPYALAQQGYRTNELVFTCINVRADSLSEASLQTYNDEDMELIKKHSISELLSNPCPGVSEQTFWKITETYLGIAGFCAWEKERDNLGRVIRLWPMRPDWCSFLRGQQKPIRAIRYQPYGLPPLDIAIEDILFFQYFDPLYPLLKGFSPTMSALEMVNTDNTMTRMLQTFMQNGNFLGGILSTENQVLQEAEAEVYKRRWQQSHGGSSKAGEIAVIGKGLKFQTTSSSFRDMVFPEVDARSEARICMVFRVPPILIGAKVGIDRSTFANYEESRKSFYEGAISNEWKYLSGIVTDQLLPDFENNPKLYICNFDTKNIKALQEDRTAQVSRADMMYKGKWAKLNEARKEAGLDPIEGEEGNMFFQESKEPEPDNNPFLENGNTEIVDADDLTNKLLPKPKTIEQMDLEDAEEKKYRTFAKKRIKENHFDDLREYEFKYLSMDMQKKLIREYEGLAIIQQLKEAVAA
jgi:HK97 family phage portal protein